MIRRLIRALTRGRFARGGELPRRALFNVYPITEAPDWCDTCQHGTQQLIYVITEDGSRLVGTYCPNCPPEEDQ